MPDQESQTSELEAKLDAFESALTAGRLQEVQEITEQLWAHRKILPAVLEQRIRTNRVQLPVIAFEMLMGFAGRRAPAVLKRIAADVAVLDIVRWGARRRAGWSERGEAKARRTFLASLADGEGTLIEALSQAGAMILPDTSILAELLAYLQALPADKRLAFVQRALDEGLPAIPWILRGALHIPDTILQLFCIEALAHLPNAAADGALGRLARTASDPAVTQAAEVALRRQQMRLVTSDDVPEAPMAASWPAVLRAQASAIDGSGAQVLLLIRDWDAGQELFTSIYCSDSLGIVDAWGLYSRPSMEIEDTLPAQLEAVAPIVDIDLSAARGMLAAAVEVAAANKKPIPPVFELWEPYFHDSYPAARNETVETTELDDAPYAARRDLLRVCDRLLEYPAFDSWFVEPDELGSVLIGPSLTGEATGKVDWTAKALPYPQLIDALFGPDSRALWRRRLRRQAWLLDRMGATGPRDVALAVAASLKDASATEIHKHPFLRAMIDRGLANFAGAFMSRFI